MDAKRLNQTILAVIDNFYNSFCFQVVSHRNDGFVGKSFVLKFFRDTPRASDFIKHGGILLRRLDPCVLWGEGVDFVHGGIIAAGVELRRGNLCGNDVIRRLNIRDQKALGKGGRKKKEGE